jgi:hypothetical protein
MLRAAGDAMPLPADPIVVRHRMRPPVLIRVLPIAPGARSPFLGARVLLMLLDLSERRPLPFRLLATSFGLTAVGAKLAGLIGAGESVERAAECQARGQLIGGVRKTELQKWPIVTRR